MSESNPTPHERRSAEAATRAGELLAMIAERSGVAIEDIRSRRRHMDLVRVRMAFICIGRASIRMETVKPGEFSPISFPLLAKVVGMACHSSAHHLASRAQQERQDNPEFRALVDRWLEEWSDGDFVALPAIDPAAPRRPGPPVQLFDMGASACRKPKNDLSPDDKDARKRLRGTARLIAAIRREHPERCAA